MKDGWRTLERTKKLITLLPFLGFMGVFYLYGIFYGVMNSLGFYRIVGESGFTLQYYRKMFWDRGFYDSLIFTGRISLISAFIALFLGVGILFLIYLNLKKLDIDSSLPSHRGSIKFQRLFSALFQKIIESPLLVPYLIGAYGVLILLMQSGILSRALQSLGVIENFQQFPILTNERGGIGIIITYVWKSTPFMVLMGVPVMKRILNRWEPLGQVYNLSDFKFFMKIILPLIFPTLAISFFIILSYFFVAFETPYLLGVTHPKALAVYIYDLYTRGELEDRGFIMAMNIALSLFTLVIGGVVYKLLRVFSKFDEKGWS